MVCRLRYLPSPFADSGAGAGIPPSPLFRPPQAEPRLRRVLFICFRSDMPGRVLTVEMRDPYPTEIIVSRAREMPENGLLDYPQYVMLSGLRDLPCSRYFSTVQLTLTSRPSAINSGALSSAP
jgi:hypothetical protein